MPFGISAAPAIWQRTMDEILAGLQGIICYLDDILIVGKSQQEHDERVKVVLGRLQQRGLRLKQEKCAFNQKEVEYLGHVINERGLRPTATKTQAIRDAPEPRNSTKLKSYLGLLNYYSRFIPEISSTLQPLYALLTKSQPWVWREAHKRAFAESKKKLLSSSCLTHYDLAKPLKLKCDASPHGVGACLTHVMADGTEQPIAFSSRTLTKEEKGYAQLEKEALALVHGVRHFHKYLMGRAFVLVTDHKPLLKILGPKQGVPPLVAARLQRWAIILSAYQYQLEFTSGPSNVEADMLSRLPLQVDVIDPNEQIYGIDYLEQLPITAKEVAKETALDPILRKVFTYTVRGWPYQRDTELLHIRGKLMNCQWTTDVYFGDNAL